MNTQEKKEPAGRIERQPSSRAPSRFHQEEEVGLGDAIKKVTYAMGKKPCTGCEKRAAALNRWMRFAG
jgi:hypothetical protein